MIELALAQQEAQAGRFEAAAAHCRTVLAKDPQHAEALGLLAVVCARSGAAEQALSFADRAVAAGPQDSRLRFNRAILREGLGDEAGAEADYVAACELDGANLPARVNHGNLLLRYDRVTEAETCFAAAAAAFPAVAEVHEGLGIALQRQKRSAEAITALRRALALRPSHPRIEANLGWSLLEDGDTAGAAMHFQSALAASPETADLWASLAAAHVHDGAWPEALAALERALALSPDHTRALAFKGIVLDALGRIDERKALVDLDRDIWHRRHTEPPEGYADLGAFNRALTAHVLAQPTLVRNRPGKTTRNGGQTGGLRETEAGPIAHLGGWIRSAVADYVPAAAARASASRFHAPPQHWQLRIWATVLDTSGYQDPHNHPSGWLSGVYYVQVPPGVGLDESDQAGWIEFGRPDPFLRPATMPDLRTVQPREGLMLVFPSYLWHRTIPFTGNTPRISIAFDVIPLWQHGRPSLRPAKET
jgi:Flp pilus assembly protein TadD